LRTTPGPLQQEFVRKTEAPRSLEWSDGNAFIVAIARATALTIPNVELSINDYDVDHSPSQ
jgi:hypothetical protein